MPSSVHKILIHGEKIIEYYAILTIGQLSEAAQESRNKITKSLDFIILESVQDDRVKRYWADRDVPYLPPVPLVGNMTFLLRENIVYWLERVYHQHYDRPYVGFWIFWRPGLLVNSPTIARNILNRDFDIFKNHLLSSGKTDPVGSLNLFTAKDPLWSHLRLQLGGLFTSAKLRKFQDYTRIKSKELVQRIHNDRNSKVDMMTLFIDYTTDVIGTTLFGIKSDATLTGAGPLRDITKDFSKYTFLRGFSDDIIVGQAAIFLFGGYDTSGRLLTFTVYELAHNQEIQDKLYQELSETVRCKGNDDFDLTTLTELPYLNAVIKETLRIYILMGWIDRVASEDYKIDDNLTIEAGTVVYINAAGMHKDPKYFPEPHKFDPERFLPENKHNIEPYTYLPFGEGPRACIGKRFGYMTVQFALAHMLLKYNILPYADSPKPSEIKANTKAVWYVPEELMYVQFVPR
ncbi:cytochrome P450 6k1-like [Melitaea cinxia]|uniref:cytochrome P450 6k1-like n=1 Tax=Melitaea cinxia TaxID=113334 RepID=UPI001E271848|nr:cytochrome P450 6k1-like [Melitaea cinxia]